MAYVIPNRRRRRGFGDLPACSSIDVPAGFVGPIECDPSSGPVSYPASQSQLAQMEQNINDALLSSGSGGGGQASIAQWVNNSVGTIVLVVAGVFVVGMLRR